MHSITTGLMQCSKNSSDQLVGTGRGRKRNERPGHRSRTTPSVQQLDQSAKSSLSPQTTEDANPRYWERP